MIFREDISILFIRFTRLRLDVDSQPFQRTKNIVPSIILSRMIGQRTISFVRAMRCKRKKREEKKVKKDIRGAQSTSKR